MIGTVLKEYIIHMKVHKEQIKRGVLNLQSGSKQLSKMLYVKLSVWFYCGDLMYSHKMCMCRCSKFKINMGYIFLYHSVVLFPYDKIKLWVCNINPKMFIFLYSVVAIQEK